MVASQNERGSENNDNNDDMPVTPVKVNKGVEKRHHTVFLCCPISPVQMQRSLANARRRKHKATNQGKC